MSEEIENVFVEFFLESYKNPPKSIILDISIIESSQKIWYNKVDNKFLKQQMESYTWGYIQKYPKYTKRLLGIDYEQLEQLIALGKLLNQKNKEEIEKTKIRINQPGSGNNPKLSSEEQIVLMLVYWTLDKKDFVSVKYTLN